jgi:riboflavin transporter FmnP
MRIISADLRHSFVGSLLNFLLMTVFNILVQGTAALANFAKVLVISNILGTDIAEDMLVGSNAIAPPKDLPLYVLAVRASHLVASILFHKRVLAAIALPNQCCGHSLFHDVS